MSNFNNINDFQPGQVLVTKKDHRMEVVSIHKDKIIEEDADTGSVCMKVFCHRDSRNCSKESYGWAHNVKYFISFIRTDGKEGLIQKIKNEGWSLKNEGNNTTNS